MSAIPPASARPVVPPAAQPTPPAAVPPGDVRQAPPTTPPDDRQDRMMGQVAGSLLTGALFVGAGLAIAFCPFLAPFFAIAGCIAGVDFLADLAGFSPVKMLSGKSIGGWIASAFSARPSEPERPQGVNPRRPPQVRARPPVETEPPVPPQRRDGEPEPAPVS